MIRVVLKARLNGGPAQVVGGYEFLPDEFEEELNGQTREEWLQNTGVDWAHDSAMDTLDYWAEFED